MCMCVLIKMEEFVLLLTNLRPLLLAPFTVRLHSRSPVVELGVPY